MTRFIFIRHGESETNKTACFAGQLNPLLTEKGEKQAELMAEWVASNYHIDYIYSSDLTRAYQTANALAEKINLNIDKDENLREINAGLWQGRTFTDINEEFPSEYDVWLHDLANAKLPEGETVKELANRIVGEVFRLKELHKDETVLVVTHATPIKMLITVLQKGDISKANEVPWVPNSSATVVRFIDNNAEFELIGYDDYLSEEKTDFSKGVV